MSLDILQKEIGLTIERLNEDLDLVRFLGKNNIEEVKAEFSNDNKYLPYEIHLQEMARYHRATYDHLLRVGILSWADYKFLINEGYNFKEKIDAPLVILAGSYHDYGKKDVDLSILEKKGPLDNAQRQEILSHPQKGVYLLDQILQGLHDIPKEYVKSASETHHEDLNGDGYTGLMDENKFTKSLQMISIVDTFDAAKFREGYQGSVPDDYLAAYLMLVSLKDTEANKKEIKFLTDMLSELKNEHKQPLFKHLKPGRYSHDVVRPLRELLMKYKVKQ
jgi:HD-GYP domain-containing protein (c-di-GMP phosphodiesterase class II)